MICSKSQFDVQVQINYSKFQLRLTIKGVSISSLKVNERILQI